MLNWDWLAPRLQLSSPRLSDAGSKHADRMLAETLFSQTLSLHGTRVIRPGRLTWDWFEPRPPLGATRFLQWKTAWRSQLDSDLQPGKIAHVSSGLLSEVGAGFTPRSVPPPSLPPVVKDFRPIEHTRDWLTPRPSLGATPFRQDWFLTGSGWTHPRALDLTNPGWCSQMHSSL